MEMAKPKTKSKAQRKKDEAEFGVLAAVDFKPLPGKFDAASFNDRMAADTRHAYLAMAMLHATKEQLVASWSEIPEEIKALADASHDTAERFRALAGFLDTAHARIVGACATHILAS
jgi:hypothetical protein